MPLAAAGTRAARSYSYPKGLLTVTVRARRDRAACHRPKPRGYHQGCKPSHDRADSPRLRASGASSACPYQRVLAQAAQIESTLFSLMASHGPHPTVRRHRRVRRAGCADGRARPGRHAGVPSCSGGVGGWPRLAAVDKAIQFELCIARGSTMRARRRRHGSAERAVQTAYYSSRWQRRCRCAWLAWPAAGGNCRLLGEP